MGPGSELQLFSKVTHTALQPPEHMMMGCRTQTGVRWARQEQLEQSGGVVEVGTSLEGCLQAAATPPSIQIGEPAVTLS